MVNKLRVVASICGGSLAVLAVWATGNYAGLGGFAPRFLPFALVGVVIIGIPALTARGKLAYRRIRYRYQQLIGHPSVGTVFVSSSPVRSPQRLLNAILDDQSVEEAFRSVEPATFESGPGIRVSHTGFHDSYVQFSDNGTLVITGTATEHNEQIAREIERVSSVAIVQSNDNPLWEPTPVHGAPRLVLGAIVVVLFVGGTFGVAGAAYPADAYNPVEKTVLVSFDLRADLGPRTSATDVRLDKAAFLVDVLAEKRTEIRWELNDTSAIRRHRREADHIARDTRAILASVRRTTTNDADRERATRIESRLTRVERTVGGTASRQLARAKNTTENRTGTVNGTAS